jgi:ribosome biogenesis protein ERB1
MVKKLTTGAKWISSIAIHSGECQSVFGKIRNRNVEIRASNLILIFILGGDNVIVGTYDKKVMWFDLDLSTKPYQTLRFHGNAIRSVAFHRRYPLFATGSDDCSLIVSHGMVYK